MEVHELTAIQRDLLFVVAGLENASGKGIKRELERTQDRGLLPGRVYSNLDELVEADYVVKVPTGGRENEYCVTDDGHDAIKHRLRWMRRYVA